MRHSVQAVCVSAVLAAVAHGTPIGRLLGSSFGVPGNNANYDYVVVGGGNAGLTLASRLVEQKAGSVAVIEAGTFYEISNGNTSQIPGTAATYVGKDQNDWQPMVDWGYITVPQAVSMRIYPSSARPLLTFPQGRFRWRVALPSRKNAWWLLSP